MSPDDCLIQQVTLSKLEPPSKYDLKVLRRWLDNSEFGNRFLYGLEKSTWEQAHEHDLVALPRPDSELETDPLTRLFMGPVVELFHALVGHLYKVAFSHRKCKSPGTRRENHEARTANRPDGTINHVKRY